MFKKNVIAAMVGLAVTVGFSGVANAVPLDALGSGIAAIRVDVLDMGTTGYPTTPAFPSTVCNTVADCNTASVTSIGDTTNPGEDTWGVLRVSNITVGSNTWNAGNGGQYLTGMFYNGFDETVSYNSTTNRYTATGLANSMILNLYLWNTDINLNAFQSLPSNRTGVDSYSSTAGAFTGNPANLWLSLIFDEFTSEFLCLTQNCSSVSANTQGFLSVIGGSSAGNYNTNTVENNSEGFSDFFLSGSPGCTGASCGEWTTQGNLIAQGYRIPEPGSMALAGLGLIGLAALRRRKQA